MSLGPALRSLVEGAAWRAVMEGETGSRARGLWRRTPLLRLPASGRPELWVKAEGLQRTGSFKVRGASALLASLSREETAAGVVTASAGNHGLGVAEAARAFGVAATVLVPETSPEVKRRGIAALGAEVVVLGAGYDEAAARAKELAASTGRRYLRAFDDEHVIAGNGGTTGAEIAEDLPGGVRAGDLVVVPVGGGGLSSGIGGSLAATGATLVGVEPETNHAMYDSFELGEALVDYPQGGPTLAEGLEGAVSNLTYRLCREAFEGIVLVSEAAIRTAMAWGYRTAGLVLEASAAASLAAALEGGLPPAERVVCVTTGSNVEPDLLDEVLREA